MRVQCAFYAHAFMSSLLPNTGANMSRSADLEAYIRTIPDYPKPGILFRDVTTLLLDPVGFRAAVDGLLLPYLKERVDVVAGIEARGFILGGAVAHELGLGFVPLRKKGKLPGKTIGQDYALEYGTDRIEIHEGAIKQGQRVLVIDDLIATGGTAEAAISLLRRSGGVVEAAAFVVDLPDLGGGARLEALGVKVHALVQYPGH
jgi:adenine phosphoribosyltransferase